MFFLNLLLFLFAIYVWLSADRYYKWARIFISPPVDDSVVVHPVIVTMVTKSFPMLDVAVVVIVVVFVSSSILAITLDSELVAFSISADLTFDSFVIVSWLPLLLLVVFKNNSSMLWISVLDLECFALMIEFVVLLVLLSLFRGWLALAVLLLLPPIIAGIRKRLFRVRL